MATDSTLVSAQLWNVVKALHYVYPFLIAVYFVVALSVAVCNLQKQRLRTQDEWVRRGAVLSLIFGVAFTYLAEVSVCGIRETVTNVYQQQDRVVYLIASAFFFGSQALALADSESPVWYPYYVTWFIGIVVELSLLIFPNILLSPESKYDFVIIVIQILRICIFIILPCLYFGLLNDKNIHDHTDTERQPLLGAKIAGKASSPDSSNEIAHGTGGDQAPAVSDDDNKNIHDGPEDSFTAKQRKDLEAVQKRLIQDGNWFTYAKGFNIFIPYIWPFHDKVLQLRALLVVFCLFGSNALNVLVPRQMGLMIDSLTKYAKGDQSQNVWIPVVMYTFLRFISGAAGIHWVRRWLWMPVEQYSYHALSSASHAHLMNLSSDFHDSKTTSDLAQAVNGGRSVADLLEKVCFEIIPMFIDLVIAFAYLTSQFGPYMGLTLIATVVSYLYLTAKMYSHRTIRRREYITGVRKEWTVGQQSLDSWHTASLFNMIPYEQRRYTSAVQEHMTSWTAYEVSAQIINAAQGLVMALGLLGALWLGVYQVVFDGKSVGQFTTLFVYWAQLSSPVEFFSSVYKSITNHLMDTERLLELFRTKPTIQDAPDSKPLTLGEGFVKFDRISFAYDPRKPTLKNISLVAPPGKTVALVGETGGGKSTILKLIDRFYDVESGSISIDDQDIRHVTISSLRENIGVVPQDPMLFNDSIMNNIRYARLSATDEEVHEACKAAAVHDKIMGFPDGYNSKVGDRGFKLSGGEKQRIAIARAILKQSKIILLDEATSAVDTETEQLIQKGLRALCRGRTTFIVAHRLSTVMQADRIFVIMHGEIIEEGSHEELIRRRGKYHDLWTMQVFFKPANNKESRSRSSSPRKQDTNIVAPVPTSKNFELMNAPSTKEQLRHESTQIGKQGEKENKKEGEGKTDSNHVRDLSSGSEFKPLL